MNGSKPKVETAESGITTEKGTSKKRSWDVDLSEGRESGIDYTVNQSSRKRPRTTREIPGQRDAVEDFVPVALQKDDISEEVERRLKLKEERRKKMSAEPEKKRKRDSTSSNNGIAKSRTKRSRDVNTGEVDR
ncbi:hypothetical protein F66182_16764 [Fusarium sp. NRRL 66182]|nr:hypothetical protein F66182_16764 [Fusarium sp. NRRL 66182]